MSAPDILFFVEHLVRELDVACLVKHYLESEEGLTVQLASTAYDLPQTLSQPAPRVVVTPWFHESEPHRDLLDAWAGGAATFVNLNYEQIYYRHQERSRSPQDVIAREHVLQHVWGAPFGEFLRRHGVPPDHVFVNGSQVLALYQPPYRAFFRSRATLAEEHGLDPNKRWLFIPDQYQYAFLMPSGLNNLVEKRSYSPASAEQHYRFEVDSFREVAPWLREAAIANPEVELVVRPRPVTAEALFRRCFIAAAGDLPDNLHVIKHGTVREWILAADAVASSFSTCLIEATIAGKPATMIVPIPFPELLEADWHAASPQVTTKPEFLHWVQQPGTRSDSLLGWARQHLCAREIDPIREIALYLLRVLRGEEPAPTISRELAFGPEGVFPPARTKEAQLTGRALVRQAVKLAVTDPKRFTQRLVEVGQRQVEAVTARAREQLRNPVQAGGSEPPVLPDHPFGLSEAEVALWSRQESSFEQDRLTKQLVEDRVHAWRDALTSETG